MLSYSLVYALRKPFTAATFDGLDFFGMDYKTATSIVQIFGYFLAKLIGIKVISELKKENRLKFIILSVAVAEASLVLFGLLPRPFNVFALFFNGLSLGCMWGVIFSFLEGRRVTDLLASLMGLSIAISSGTAKSAGLYVMDGLHISEFWMPAFIGAFAFPLLSLLGWLMTRLPQPTEADKALRTERVTLDGRARRSLFKSFMPVLVLLFGANLFITVMQDIKEHTDSILVLQKSIRSAVLRKESREGVSKCSKEKTSQPLMLSVLSPREKDLKVEDDVLFITQMLVNRCLEAEFNVPASIVKYMSTQGEGALVKSYRKKETCEVVEAIDCANLYGVYECKKGVEYAIL